MAEKISYSFFKSSWGELTLASSAHGVCLVQFGRSLARAREAVNGHWGAAEWVESPRANRELAGQLRQYFSGQRRTFKLPLDLRGGPFQMRAWRELKRIPFGKTRSYQELARAAGSPRGARAAGMACGGNRVAIVVPCHRVVGGNGSLTGFGGGLEWKRRLLAHEGALAAR